MSEEGQIRCEPNKDSKLKQLMSFSQTHDILASQVSYKGNNVHIRKKDIGFLVLVKEYAMKHVTSPGYTGKVCHNLLCILLIKISKLSHGSWTQVRIIHQPKNSHPLSHHTPIYIPMFISNMHWNMQFIYSYGPINEYEVLSERNPIPYDDAKCDHGSTSADLSL